MNRNHFRDFVHGHGLVVYFDDTFKLDLSGCFNRVAICKGTFGVDYTETDRHDLVGDNIGILIYSLHNLNESGTEFYPLKKEEFEHFLFTLEITEGELKEIMNREVDWL